MANGVIINSRYDTELYNECRESFHRSTEEPSFRRSRCRSTKNTTSHISASIVTDLKQKNTGTPTDITHCASTARRALTFLYHSPYHLSYCVNCGGVVSTKALKWRLGLCTRLARKYIYGMASRLCTRRLRNSRSVFFCPRANTSELAMRLSIFL